MISGMPRLEDHIKNEARTLGFELVGIAAAGPADRFDQFRDWLERGFAGEMDYMHRHAAARRHPASILPDVRSVVMVGLNYSAKVGSHKSEVNEPPRARVARYALGADYHAVMRTKLKELLQRVRALAPECHGRAVVDTAPLLERDFARRAGLGWFGKNTMLLNKRRGSYFFLGALLLDLELAADTPHEANHCGTCTACLDACPTDAFPAPYQLDSRKCISYLTIELRGPIPADQRPGIGDWVFGCDVCQEVCPWNRKEAAFREPAFAPRAELSGFDSCGVLALSEAEFRVRFRRTALMRAGRTGVLRNAALVLGNQGDPSALPALRHAATDVDPAVRDAAQWAIERITAAYPEPRP
jgi:epoxyqueuosine reductase